MESCMGHRRNIKFHMLKGQIIYCYCYSTSIDCMSSFCETYYLLVPAGMPMDPPDAVGTPRRAAGLKLYRDPAAVPPNCSWASFT